MTKLARGDNKDFVPSTPSRLDLKFSYKLERLARLARGLKINFAPIGPILLWFRSINSVEILTSYVIGHKRDVAPSA